MFARRSFENLSSLGEARYFVKDGLMINRQLEVLKSEVLRANPISPGEIRQVEKYIYRIICCFWYTLSQSHILFNKNKNLKTQF